MSSDIDKLNYDDVSGNELTGGYIVKVDKTTAGGIVAWTSPYTCAAPGTGPIEFQMHDPEIDTMHPAQLFYIENYITELHLVPQNSFFGEIFQKLPLSLQCFPALPNRMTFYYLLHSG